MTAPNADSPHTNAPQRDAPHFSPTDDADRDRGQYHAVSGWAIAALLLGLLSVTALFGPILWFVPVLAAICALVAMRRIEQSQGELSGWNLALLGLLLAVFFGVAGPARTMTRRLWIDNRAAEFADAFIQLLQRDQAEAAYQLTRPPASRKGAAGAAPHGDAEAERRPPGAPDPHQEFLTHETTRLLREHRDAKVERLDVDMAGEDDQGEYPRVTYRLTYPDGGGKKTLDFRLVLKRSLAYQSHAEQWQMLWPPTILSQ